MSLTLEDAIEIHGRALKYRKGAKIGAAFAEEEAQRCKANGDDEGFDVWLKVSAVIARLDGEARAESAGASAGRTDAALGR